MIENKNLSSAIDKIWMGTHHLWYVKGTYIGPSYTLFILSDKKLFELYHLWLEVHCIKYELRLFMAKAFPLLKLIMTSTGWGAVSTILYDPDSNPRPSHTDPGVLLLSQICWTSRAITVHGKIEIGKNVQFVTTKFLA